jgi:hypothetical protein
MSSCTPELRSFGEELKEFLQTEEALSLVRKACPGWRRPWISGACGILADALKLYLGREAVLWGIWGILPFAEGIGHVAVQVDGCFLDSDGASTEQELMERWLKRGIEGGELMQYVKKDFKGEVKFNVPTSRTIAAALEERFGPGF